MPPHNLDAERTIVDAMLHARFSVQRLAQALGTRIANDAQEEFRCDTAQFDPRVERSSS
jgi:hypothetical protein